MTIVLWLQGDAPCAPCVGLDSATATLQERREALAACAQTSSSQPLEYFVSQLGQLAARDRRAESYCELALSWTPAEWTASPALARLVAIAGGGIPAAEPARVIAMRVLASLPKEGRPAGCPDADPVVVAIAAVPSRMTYDTREFTVAAGRLVRIDFVNADALEHNLLVVAPGALAEMGLAGDRMGQTPDGKAKEFVPDSPKVLAVMGLVAPGKSSSLWFIAPAKPATYPYVCTYPAHWRTMNGKMKVTESATPPAESPSPK